MLLDQTNSKRVQSLVILFGILATGFAVTQGLVLPNAFAEDSAYQANSVNAMDSVTLEVEEGFDFRALNMDPDSKQPAAVVDSVDNNADDGLIDLLEDESAEQVGTMNRDTAIQPNANVVPNVLAELEVDTLKSGNVSVESSPQRKEQTLDEADFAPIEAKAVVVDIVSDTLNYDTDTSLYTATGSVHVIISEQNTEMTADKVVYDKNTELMVAEGSVVIDNKGEKTYGTYAKIDLTRKSALINDPITILDQIRIKSREGLIGDNNYVELYDGKLVVPAGLAPTAVSERKRRDDGLNELTDGDLSRLAVADPFMSADSPVVSQNLVNANGRTYQNKLVAQELDMSWDTEQTGIRSKFRIHSKDVEVVRNESGYDDINLINPQLKFGDFTLASLPQMDFARDGEREWTEYLGPDIGIDPDLGGAYAGPGWDFRAGKGIFKVSPLASVGVGARRTRGGREINRSTGAGVGAFINYMSPDTRSWLAYSTQTDTPIFMFDKKILDGKTHVMAGANEDYTLGFLGWERPKYVGQVYDSRKLYANEWMRMDTYASAGVAQDEFFPTSDDQFFVEPDNDDDDPQIAGRVQVQAQFRNTKPLLRIGDQKNHVDLGLTSQLGAAAYSTGDLVGVWRSGPSAMVTLGNRFRSFNRYFYAVTGGDSPFVFDQYYRGRNSVQSVNQFRVNRHLTVGLRTNMALERDNAQNALFTGNSFFMLVGPEDVKLNIGYDFVRQRSYFGINFLPGAKRKTLHFDRLQMYQPTDYGLMSKDTSASANPLANQDVGMMNGMKAP